MKKEMLIFLLGFFSCAFMLYAFSYSSVEVPSITGFVPFRNNVEAPSDWVSDSDIIILKDKIILKIPEATLSSYADTGSMKPLFDEGANGIRIKPKSAEEIEVGDIISYRSFGFLVVHRVVEKGEDDKGTYFITQGDNNAFSDGKVRFEDIKYITIGIIY
jgi:hypothetical protein